MSDIPVIRQADLILRGGRIHTLDAAGTVAPSLAVVDGLVAAVGDDREVSALVGPSTEVKDLAGAVVVPGLNDSHLHLVDTGNSYNFQVRWDGVASLADALAMLRMRAAQASPGQWVRVLGGWSEHQFAEHRLPSQEEIESVSSEVPVLVAYLDSQVYFNQAAAKILGYNGASPAAFEAAVLAGLFAVPPPAPELDEQVASTQRFLHELNRLGVTSAVDVGSLAFPDSYGAVRMLNDQGRLTVRTSCDVPASAPDFRRLVETLRLGGDERLSWDGAGLMIRDFADFRRPRPNLPDSLERYLEPLMRLLIEARWPFRVSATYEESIQRVLGVLEKVNQDIPLDGLRWAVSHADTIWPRTVDRIAALGGGIAVQHRMAYRGEQYAAQYGDEEVRYTAPVMKMLERGIPVGAGTDGSWNASYNPWLALRWLVTGQTVGGTAMWAPEDCLDRTLALRLFTEGSAWFSGEQGKKGTLEPGKYADLAVLSGDYFSVPAEEIANLASVMTVVGGRIVHEG